MNLAYKILRGVSVTLIVLPTLVAVLCYILLSLPWAQNLLRDVAQSELTSLLGSEVKIGSVDISPFDKLRINDISINDDYGYVALRVKSLDAGVDISRLIANRRIVVDYVALGGLKLDVYKPTDSSELNIAGIIRRLTSKDKPKTQTHFKLKVNTLVIDDATLSYEVKDAPDPDPTVFDKNHIEIYDLNLSANIPLISDDAAKVRLYSLNFKERSGFALTNLTATVGFDSERASLTDFSISLPDSYLALGNLSIPRSILENPATLADRAMTMHRHLNITKGSHITPCNLSAFVPALSTADFPIDIALSAIIDNDYVAIDTFSISQPDNNLLIEFAGNASHIYSLDSIIVDLPNVHFTANGVGIASYLSANFPKLRNITQYIKSLGDIDFQARLSASHNNAFLSDAALSTKVGVLNLAADLSTDHGEKNIEASLTTDGIDLTNVLIGKQLGYFAGEVSFDASGKNIDELQGNLNIIFDRAEYRDYVYHDVVIQAQREGDIVEAYFSIDDDNIKTFASSRINLDPDVTEIEFDISLKDFRPDVLGLDNHYPGYTMSAAIDGHFLGRTIESADGTMNINNVSYTNAFGDGLHLKHFEVSAANSESPSRIDLRSDFANGYISGRYNFASLPSMAVDIVSIYFPSLVSPTSPLRKEADFDDITKVNAFEFELTINECSDICKFLRLPISVIHTVTVSGEFNSVNKSINTYIDAPFLQQGTNKILIDTALGIDINKNTGTNIYATTSFDTKKGPMSVVLAGNGIDNRLNTKISWEIVRDIPINGLIDFSTFIKRDVPTEITDVSTVKSFPLSATVQFNPGGITFGDTFWHIIPSTIVIEKDKYTVNNFTLGAGQERLNINGRVSKSVDDKLTVDLRSIELYDIFETLQINKALIGGRATGVVTASSLLSRDPVIVAPGLTVDSISYNRCVFGDAVVKADFDVETKAFTLDADISQYDNRHTRIAGEIFAARDSLDINFYADKVKVGFLKPFVINFADHIGGNATGHARLFGTFKNIDLEADLHVDSLSMGIGFTNTTYTVLDNDLHIKPGLINFDNITLHDAFGQTANLNGELKHIYFKDPVFTFDITDADRLLVYDTSEKINPRWFGRIFGNGAINIAGRPGVVDINVKMETTAGSSFSFAMLDMVDAREYSFISFTDRTVYEVVDSLIDFDDTPEIVKKIRADKAKGSGSDRSSAYNLDLDVKVTDDATIQLIMDPLAGDKITAHGAGNMHLTYGSENEDLRIIGSYTLISGKYRFTLQDIIVKEFNILNGSSITFRGDPNAAHLDIQAALTIPRVNLSDLDPSFAQDRDLTRQMVPVQAILKLTGDVRQPDIGYDFAFPGSSEDVYRRAMSIIGNTEMRTRQVIYLLALNRFYTPDYMSGTRSNNELFSVASSTVSSQIGNMLGSLSENWSIAPNLRSERGDFSDVEVDVALTSTLLNNRLIFNGNFGYRDQTMNTNQFVGDFDIEYLLNPAGTWRLKAYNRYNDQNYYLRSAATTQGIGIVYKRDFNNMFNFFRRKKAREDAAGKNDSVPSKP